MRSCVRTRGTGGNGGKGMELLANWTGLIAVGCILAMSALGAVAYLDANRRTQGIRTSSELEADIGRMSAERNALGEEVAH